MKLFLRKRRSAGSGRAKNGQFERMLDRVNNNNLSMASFSFRDEFSHVANGSVIIKEKLDHQEKAALHASALRGNAGGGEASVGEETPPGRTSSDRAAGAGGGTRAEMTGQLSLRRLLLVNFSRLSKKQRSSSSPCLLPQRKSDSTIPDAHASSADETRKEIEPDVGSENDDGAGLRITVSSSRESSKEEEEVIADRSREQQGQNRTDAKRIDSNNSGISEAHQQEGKRAGSIDRPREPRSLSIRDLASVAESHPRPKMKLEMLSRIGFMQDDCTYWNEMSQVLGEEPNSNGTSSTMSRSTPSLPAQSKVATGPVLLRHSIAGYPDVQSSSAKEARKQSGPKDIINRHLVTSSHATKEEDVIKPSLPEQQCKRINASIADSNGKGIAEAQKPATKGMGSTDLPTRLPPPKSLSIRELVCVAESHPRKSSVMLMMLSHLGSVKNERTIWDEMARVLEEDSKRNAAMA